MEKRQITVGKKHEGLRLDKGLAMLFSDISRTRIQEAIKAGWVKVNGAHKATSYHLKEKDFVELYISKRESAPVPFADIDIPVIYEDEEIIVVDKPTGLIVHPVGRDKDSLVGDLLRRGIALSNLSSQRPGVVHRLDKATSGVMVLAKNDPAHLWLASQFRKREVAKEYQALVEGIFITKSGMVDAPLKREKYKPTMKVSFIGAKQSLTFYEVVKEKGNVSLVKLTPKTGRMHQLRVHLAFLGHPIIGDVKYNGPPGERLFLHAMKLGFFHPATKKFVAFSSRVPASFEARLNQA
ncbi:RluA family pseudouridine synthase [Candidatus Omnitrophota bacterium]